MLLSEQTGDETLRYYYDATGKVTSFTYKKGCNAEVSYFYTRNLQGDIIVIYRNSDSALIGIYEYDLWGRPVSVTEATKGIDTDGILTKNPFRYRGYYYDTETGFYNLNARYYDPEIRRFISADSLNVLMIATASINCKNLFSYSENNPVNNKDSNGTVVETVFDIVTLVASIVDVCCHPKDPWAWACLAGDTVDLIPFVTCVGEGVKGLRIAKMAGKADDIGDGLKWLRKADDVADGAKALKRADTAADGAKHLKKKKINPKKLGDADISDLDKLPKNKIKELGGEGYTQGAKRNTGKSKANLYWDKEGNVFSVPNEGGAPQWVDFIPRE